MSLRFIIISLFAPINVSIWSLIILPQHCLWCFNGGSDPYVQHQENEKKISHAWGHLTLSACVWSTCVSSRLYYGRYLIGCLFSLPQTQVAQVWGLWVFGLSPAVFSLNAFSGVDGRISHSPTRHMFRLNIHIYTQSAVVSTSWSHMGNMSLSIMYMWFFFCFFFCIQVALDTADVKSNTDVERDQGALSCVSSCPFHLLSPLSPFTLLTLMRCSWLTKTNFPALWVRLCPWPCVHAKGVR